MSQREFITFAAVLLLALPFTHGLAANSPPAAKTEVVHPGETLLAESGLKRVPLVELFSSESCSSCPPADIWFSEFAGYSGVFKEFVPVAFQVDYWNYLNWKDEYSSHAATQRQMDLSKRWPTPSVYTPGVVLDGLELKDWRGKSAASFGDKEASADMSVSVYQKDGSGFRVVVKPYTKGAAAKGPKGFRLQMVSLLFNVKTKVTSGENSGRELKHNFLVSDWATMTCDSLPCEKDFHLSKLAQKISEKDPKKQTDKRAVAAWVESIDSPVALQSTGAFLK